MITFESKYYSLSIFIFYALIRIFYIVSGVCKLKTYKINYSFAYTTRIIFENYLLYSGKQRKYIKGVARVMDNWTKHEVFNSNMFNLNVSRAYFRVASLLIFKKEMMAGISEQETASLMVSLNLVKNRRRLVKYERTKALDFKIRNYQERNYELLHDKSKMQMYMDLGHIFKLTKKHSSKDLNSRNGDQGDNDGRMEISDDEIEEIDEFGLDPYEEISENELDVLLQDYGTEVEANQNKATSNEESFTIDPNLDSKTSNKSKRASLASILDMNSLPTIEELDETLEAYSNMASIPTVTDTRNNNI